MLDKVAVNGVSFELTEEQKMLQKMARDFAATGLIPAAEHYDHTAEFPAEIVKKAYGLGLTILNVPEEYGGAGANVLEECLVGEELGYGCSGMGTAISVNNLATLPIRLGASEQQKA